MTIQLHQTLNKMLDKKPQKLTNPSSPKNSLIYNYK